MLTAGRAPSITQTARTDDACYLAAAVLLRIAGLPFGTSLRLRFEETAAWADAVLDAECRAANEAGPLSLMLEARIGEIAPDDPQRVPLINIRRDIFNRRRPRPASMTAAESLLDDLERARLHRWLAEQEVLARDVASGAVVMARELAVKREALRQIARQEDLRAAILLQSSVLDAQMNGYLNADGQPDKAGRRVERSILEFVFRAACKTSPFSTLASIGFGEFVNDGRAEMVPAPISVTMQSRIRLNMAVLSRISRLIAAADHLRGDLTVTMTSSWKVKLEQLRYVRRRVVVMDEEVSPIPGDSIHEELFYLASGIAMSSVIELLPPGEMRVLGEVASMLWKRSPKSSREDVDHYLGHLVRLGVLVVPALQVDIHAPDPLAKYELGVHSIGTAWSQELADKLHTAGRLVQDYGSGGIERRRAILREIRLLITQIIEGLSAEVASVPKTLVYEDCFIDGDGLRFNRQLWEQETVRDLKTLSSVLAAFDTTVPRRLLTRTYFLARHGQGGRCGDFQEFAHEFQRDFLQPYNERMAMRRTVDENNRLTPLESGMRQPELRAIDKARWAAAEKVVAAWTDPNAEEIRLGRDFVDAIVDEMPRLPDLIQPWAFFAQLVPREPSVARDRLVINQIYSGMTLLFSRFAHGLTTPSARSAQEILSEELDRVSPAGTVFAELRGGYDTTNLNLHPKVTAYEIVCPGEVSTRPETEQIPIEDLIVVHDAAADRLKLVSRRLGMEVVPVYLGFLLPVALPEVQQVLMSFSPQGMATLDLWTGTGQLPDNDQVTRRPRITLGDLVLERQTWTVPAASFPQRGADETDSHYFLGVNRWRRSHGLPRHVFARVAIDRTKSRATMGAEEADKAGKKSDKRPVFSRKPLAVDFDSWFSILLLENLHRVSQSGLLVSEALPGPDQLWARDHQGNRYVSEFVIELYGEVRAIES
jgi:Lantibiotic dehydratase, N terminus